MFSTIENMVDLHSHIIPNIDDGSKSMDETIEMIKKARMNCIDYIVATPHYINNKYTSTKEDNILKVEKINSLLKEKNINITILLGNEIMLDTDTLELLEEDKISTINNSKYVLIEFNMQILYPNIYNILNLYIQKGYIPIIAHPERYRYIQKDINIAKKLVEVGCILQMNLSSLSNYYGKDAKNCLKQLLKNKLIGTWGSDIHYNRKNVYNNFYKELVLAKKLTNNDKLFNDIFLNNSYKIINNENI